jgi:hypothetical protein
MKSKVLIISFFALAACHSKSKKETLSVQGLYVGQYETEYSKGRDTIEIKPINSNAGTFHFIRRVGYQRISNGLLGQLEHKADSTTCVFTKENAQLMEQRHGNRYFLSADGKQLVFGNTFYKRIQ